MRKFYFMMVNNIIYGCDLGLLTGTGTGTGWDWTEWLVLEVLSILWWGREKKDE